VINADGTLEIENVAGSWQLELEAKKHETIF
jgi:hypothetical protein